MKERIVRVNLILKGQNVNRLVVTIGFLNFREQREIRKNQRDDVFLKFLINTTRIA